MSFKLVRAVDYVRQFDAEYQLAISCGCFQIHGSLVDRAHDWQQLGCHRLRMLIGWAFSAESKAAHLLHMAGVPFNELVIKPSAGPITTILHKRAPPVVPKPVFPQRRKPAPTSPSTARIDQNLERAPPMVPKPVFPQRRRPLPASASTTRIAQNLDEVMEDDKSDAGEGRQKEATKCIYRRIPDEVFVSIGFPLVTQERNGQKNAMNDLSVPPLRHWDALVASLSTPDGILADVTCTGQELHRLATAVDWKGADLGRSASPLMGWACRSTTNVRTKSGCLGYSLGEAVPNLLKKMRAEGFAPCKKL